MSSKILRCFGYWKKTKIHPNIIDTVTSNESSYDEQVSSVVVIIDPITTQPLQQKDPCASIYVKYKEPGAYDKYNQTLLSSRI